MQAQMEPASILKAWLPGEAATTQDPSVPQVADFEAIHRPARTSSHSALAFARMVLGSLVKAVLLQSITAVVARQGFAYCAGHDCKWQVYYGSQGYLPNLYSCIATALVVALVLLPSNIPQVATLMADHLSDRPVSYVHDAAMAFQDSGDECSSDSGLESVVGCPHWQLRTRHGPSQFVMVCEGYTVRQ